MNIQVFNEHNYGRIWRELNQALAAIERDQNLGAALRTLFAQQLDAGFIQDDLKSVTRYRLPDHRDPARLRSFTVQFNPRRSLRAQGGAARKDPPPGLPGACACFLCREGVRWQQRGVELGYDLAVAGRNYIVWPNPFPLMPLHTTIARMDHVPQSWRGADDAERIRSILQDLLAVARLLPGFIGFYNGDGAGASIPSHFHFQFFGRTPGHEPFPLERAAGIARADKPGDNPVVVTNYPITAIYFRGTPERIVDQASEWVSRWTRCYRGEDVVSANIIAAADAEGLHLYFVPRNKAFSHAPGMSGMVAGLEILGELVFSTEAEKQLLDAGRIDYRFVSNALAAVEPPGVHELLTGGDAGARASRGTPNSPAEGQDL